MTGDVYIGRQEFRDQRERMVEEWDVSEEDAEEAFTNVKTQVMMASQDLEKEWSDETVNAVTNLVMAIQQQQYRNSQRRRSHFYDRLFRFLTGSLMAAFAGFGVWLLVTGMFVPGGIFLIAWATGAAWQHLSR